MGRICICAAYLGTYDSARCSARDWLHHPNAVSSARWLSTRGRQKQGFKEDSVNPGFRPEILELAVPALSKAMELTLDSTEVAAIQSLDHGDDEALETIEQALIAPGAEGMRPTSQLAKIVTALLWLDRIEEACESHLHASVATDTHSSSSRVVTGDCVWFANARAECLRCSH
jgi:hypothetical protein